MDKTLRNFLSYHFKDLRKSIIKNNKINFFPITLIRKTQNDELFENLK